jgi:hypothetical protein
MHTLPRMGFVVWRVRGVVKKGSERTTRYRVWDCATFIDEALEERI